MKVNVSGMTRVYNTIHVYIENGARGSYSNCKDIERRHNRRERVREVEMVQEEKKARGKNNVKGSRDVNNMGRK